VKQLESNVLVVIDNFLDMKDPLYEEIIEDSLWDTPPKNSWIDKGETPNNVWEAVTRKVWNYASTLLPRDFDGFEYWASQINKGNCLPIHKDKDEALYTKTGQLEHPFIGSVYYCHKELPTGGFLQIERGRSRELERIQPVPNRLVLFDSSNFHSVSEVRHGFRRHLATNIWLKKPDLDNFDIK
jgi:Rps23 Pro-64 3,4-dihydroxylase Tpa1-like proline 4-hydroxylase